MNFLLYLTYNKIDVIITLASKSNEVTKVCTRYVSAYLFFIVQNKEKAGVRLPQRLIFVCVLAFIIIIT